jgi:hypothetical protein
MIFDGTQLLHFKAILGMTDCGSGLLKWHATCDIIDR